MITAVDSSVLFDVLTDDPRHGGSSKQALQDARAGGIIVACPIVWAEVRAHFKDASVMREAFAGAGIRFDPFDEASADLAGELWAAYRKRGGPRSRLVSDFLVGAHAKLRAQRLLARDRGFYRAFFRGLPLIDPTPPVASRR